jgi:ribosomal subunit interface protein
MKINLQAKNFELNEQTRDYILKRVTNLGKLLEKIEQRGGEVNVNFEVGRTTNHHRGGEIFYANCDINIDGEKFYLSEDSQDVNTAVDAVKENLFAEIRKSKDRKQALFTRGARKIKNMMKGLGSYRPWRK